MNISQPTLRSGEHQKQCYTLIPSPWVQAEHIRYWHICEGKPHNQLIWNLNVDLEWVKGWVVMQVTGLLYELYICNRRKNRRLHNSRQLLAEMAKKNVSNSAAAAWWRGGEGCLLSVAPKVRARWFSTKPCNVSRLFMACQWTPEFLTNQELRYKLLRVWLD